MLARIFCLVDTTDDLSLLPSLATAGIDGFQLRAKTATTRELMSGVATALDTGAMVVVNDRLDVAVAAGAHGVHLGANDLPVLAARRIAPGLVIGATCRTPEEVHAARVDGADYAGFGPVFATTSKSGLPGSLGISALAAAALTGGLPLIGIGGVDATRAPAVMAAGAAGVAVIGSIWRQPDPVQSARELVHAIG